jgi:hypothetical protein
MARYSTNNSNSNSSAQQPMMSGLVDSARERPFAAAAAVGGAVAAGAFLWSRRSKISDQLGNMSGQISDWSGNMRKQGQSSMQSGTDSSSRAGARSSIPTGTESPGQPEMAGAGTSSPTSSTRATGGLGGKAQGGQNLNPSRTASEGFNS